MAGKSPSNETLLEQLRAGTAEFELVSAPVSPISTTRHPRFSPPSLRVETSHRFFARIGPSLGDGGSPAMKKVEQHSVQKVTGDGRCMFRALIFEHSQTSPSSLYISSTETSKTMICKVKGMAMNKGLAISSWEERNDADELRMAVKEVICESDQERRRFEEVLVAITVDESLKRYCQRIQRPDFWGGESELLVLSKLCRQPIIVYIPEREHSIGGRGAGFIPIAEYGAEFSKATKKSKPRKAVKLLYSGKNHYDLLV